jgi:hypothetical protein
MATNKEGKIVSGPGYNYTGSNYSTNKADDNYLAPWLRAAVTPSSSSSNNSSSSGTSATPQTSNNNYSYNYDNNYSDNSYNRNYDLMSEISRIQNAKNESRKSALQDVLNKAQSNLDAEKATIAPKYYDLKNQESSTSQLRAKRIGELMAERGYSEGMQGQKELQSNMQLQSNLGALGRQEQSAYDDIAKRVSDAQSAYNTGVAQANADNDVWAAEQRLNELATQRSYAREDAQNQSQRDIALAQLMGTYNGQKTLAGQQLDSQNSQWQKQFDYGKSRDTVSDSQWQKQFDYGKTRDEEQDYQWQKQYNNQVKQQELDNLYRQQTFDYQKTRDTVSDTQWQKTLDLNLRQQSFSEAQQKIENALAQQRITQDEAAQALQYAKYNADQDQQSYDNQNKQYNTYLQMGVDRLNQRTNYEGTSTPIYSNDQMMAWVRGLNLTSEQKARLANDLGL